MITPKQDFKLLIGYQNQNKYRQALKKLAVNTFDLSFEDWYQAGYWNEKYIPYTLFDDQKAIANVSVNVINFDVLGSLVKTIQIGTVMTAKEYRNQGLNRLLMEHVLKDWSDVTEFIYLYANPTVLELYPKFGFKCAHEHMYFGTVERSMPTNSSYEKLDMLRKKDRDLLYYHIKDSVCYGKIAMHDNNDLVMFYATSLLKDNIYYLPSENSMAIATIDGETIQLWDVFSLQCIELDKIIATIASPSVKKIRFGFTPIDCSSYEVKLITEGDTLFIKSKQNSIFDGEPLMFPILSHA